VADQQECVKLLLSLSGVDRLSTEMFATLILLNKRMLKKGGRLKLCEPVSYVREVLSQTKLDEILGIEQTEASGLAAFA
jgi:anti-anti-sigma factor